MEKIKKTIDVGLHNEAKLNFLMAKIGFVEIKRVATGGFHSSPSLLITYKGNKYDFHYKGYILEKSNNNGLDFYYTIKNPDGISFKTFEEFKKFTGIEPNFDYHELN